MATDDTTRQFDSNVDLEYLEIVDQVLATVRHEMGNSINSIKMALEVLVRNYDLLADDHKLKMLRGALEQTERQTMVMRALKTYSKTVVENIEDIPFAPLWGDFATTAAEKANRRGIGLETTQPSEPFWIRADRNASRIALDHLLSNALESAAGVEEPKIRVYVESSDGRLWVGVCDNGPAIPETILPKVCIPMFTTKKKHPGIGLAVVQKILAKMNGILHIDSSKVGNRFAIGFQLSQPTSRILKKFAYSKSIG